MELKDKKRVKNILEMFIIAIMANVTMQLVLLPKEMFTRSVVALFAIVAVSVYIKRKKIMSDISLKDVKYTILGAIGCILLQEGIGIVFGAAENIPMEIVKTEDMLYMAVVTLIIAPIVEESVFREIFKEKLGEFLPCIVLIVVNGVFFAGFHFVAEPVVFVVLMVCGAVMMYCYLKTGKLFTSIGIHFLLNVYAFRGLF